MSTFVKHLRNLFMLLMVVSLLMFASYNIDRETVMDQLYLIKNLFWHEKSMMPVKDVPHGYKIILFYTPYFEQMPWPHTTGKEKSLKDFNGVTCKVNSCYISYSREDFLRSHGVVFHGCSKFMPSPKKMNLLLLKKPKDQKWMWFNEENPENTGYPLRSLSNMFDFPVTYLLDSDIHAPYGYYAPVLNNSSHAAEAKKDYSAGKDRLVLWVSSNCAARLRLRVVKEISKHVRVDVYGSCQKHFRPIGECRPSSAGNCDFLFKRYKFYLAFENVNCKGYLTEKYWHNAIDKSIVPVVVAGSYNKDVLIPGSYIDILDFPNATSLASYLKYLDSNDTAYNSYFEWKEKYTFSTSTWRWVCDICETLQRNTSTGEGKQPWDLQEYWGPQNCHANDSHIKNVWLKSVSPPLKNEELLSKLVCMALSVYNAYEMINYR